jgi:ATP-dependent RNA helicase SUPV3L1/SUV3
MLPSCSPPRRAPPALLLASLRMVAGRAAGGRPPPAAAAAAAAAAAEAEERRASSRGASTSGLADLTAPASWYPLARAMPRRLVAHWGPTNSGKTHAALAALKAARSGVYAGPLRLLALEVFDRLNADGVPCNLARAVRGR